MAFKLSETASIPWRDLKKARNSTGNILFDLAPLVDIVFTLILFFMLTSPFITQWGIKVTLPALKNISPISNSEVEITITADNQLFIGAKLIEPNDLKRTLQTLAQNNKAVAIVSDTNAHLGKVLEVRDLAIETGIKQLNIRTRVKTNR